MTNPHGGTWQRSVRRMVAATTVGVIGATAVAVPVAGASSGSGSSGSSGASLVGALTGTVSGVGHVVGSITTDNSGKGSHDEFSSDGTTRPQTLGDVAKVIRSEKFATGYANGRGVDVALLDTGIADVAGLTDPGTVIDGPDLSLDRQVGASVGVDGYGHGTHMAGIIAGRGDASSRGIAPGARLLNMKVGAADGTVDISQVIASIDWVVQHRNDPGLNVRVISLSLGTDALQSYQVDPLSHAVESAWRNNIVVVVAAGNSGGALTNPAIDPFVIAVGAASTGDPKKGGDDVVAGFSSVGDAKRSVDLVAPGVSIISSVDPRSNAAVNHPDAMVGPSTIKGSGTSQATAVVAGAVADLISAKSSLSPDQVKAVLMNTASDIDDSQPRSQGAGLINVESAMGSLLLSGLNPAQNFKRSTGLGSLELARGGNHLAAADGTELSGEFDITGAPWNPSTWAPLATAGRAWTGGTWNGTELTGTGWADAGTGVNADGTPFVRSTWRASTWRASTWRASTWRASTWRASTWRASTWRGSTWRDIDG